MLYYLFSPLRDSFIFFNLFRYITFRAACSAVLAFVISLVIGPYVIRRLRELQIGEEIWVLHAFQKKSKAGIKTPKAEIDLIHERLKRLKERIR